MRLQKAVIVFAWFMYQMKSKRIQGEILVKVIQFAAVNNLDFRPPIRK